jgi:DNA repair protein RecO (recombination protein O)
MTRRVVGEAAYLLHARPYRETSGLLELLTERYGRVSCVGRGLRGQRRAQAPVPFVRMRVGFGGRSALMNWNGFEVEARHALEGRALFSGLYLNELMLRVLRNDDPHPSVFAGYERTLAELAASADLEAALRRFERLLLRECGYEITLDTDAETGEAIDADATYRFTPDTGFSRCDESPDGARTFLGATLLAIHGDDYADQHVRRAAKRILRRALEPHVGERPLVSRELFRRAPKASER